MPRFPKPFFKKSHQAWYVQLDGRQVRLGPDEAEAHRHYHALMAEGPKHDPPPSRTESPQLIDIFDHFLTFCREQRAPDTYEWYRWRLQMFVDEIAGRLTVAQLKPYHLDDWFAKHPDWASGTKNGMCRAVQRALRWAERRGRIERSPIAFYEKPRLGKRTVVVTPVEFEEMIACVPQQEFRDLLTVTWETAARPQESLVVEARHVDLANGRWVFPAEESKVDKWPRVVYLTPEALAITRRLMLKSPTGPLFRNSNGDPWTTFSVNCAFIRLQTTIGMKRLKASGEMPPQLPRLKGSAKRDPEMRTAHGRMVAERRRDVLILARKRGPKRCLYHLRHSWLDRALKSGVDALTAAILMGHRDPSTISKVYQHLSQSPEYLRGAAERASNGFNTAAGA
jgi:integrase